MKPTTMIVNSALLLICFSHPAIAVVSGMAGYGEDSSESKHHDPCAKLESLVQEIVIIAEQAIDDLLSTRGEADHSHNGLGTRSEVCHGSVFDEYRIKQENFWPLPTVSEYYEDTIDLLLDSSACKAARTTRHVEGKRNNYNSANKDLHVKEDTTWNCVTLLKAVAYDEIKALYDLYRNDGENIKQRGENFQEGNRIDNRRLQPVRMFIES